ncbi:helix-turn-helix domain-containing protein [Salinirubellus salinus]|uniref:Helix-turn-helix domain-containing protein n=1 Tax=Salinirubellus salinus TaxID=1364945 RepID=A0A9E7R0R2_9EURY|nr:helix-turn-helix domain-containing protein [Salinirubellus salinus]UWM53407.1 helix-turn-helix domain-containing protein [Salinirubellus salinus]
MARLEHVTVEQLHDALDVVDGKRPAQRILAAIAYKDGVTQATLADRHGVSQKTIYSWLQRFTPASLDGTTVAQAATDADRPGRPRRLGEEERERLERHLHDPPTEVGLDAPAWTPALLQAFLRDTFDVAYSRPSCRRLLREAGLTYCPPRDANSGAERGETETSDDEGRQRVGGWTLP